MTEDLSLAKLIAILAREAQMGVQREIPGFLASRGIESLYHFTSIKNLASIAKYGLMGRELLTSNGYDFIASDAVRVEPVENAICLSLSKPNNFMASRKISSGHELVLLEIGKVTELLTNYCFIATPGNFGSEALKRKLQDWPEEFIGGAGLLNLFKNDALRTKYEITDSEPTDPQSEILLLEPIPWNFITRIISPGLRGYAPQDEVRKVVQLLPRGAVFQSQNPEIFPEINWRDSKIAAEFNERRWNESWE
ncbi:ssDNA thymidine ADP-ribosyltransferase, DarT [Candidatus Nanopelagicaceae bacterium]